MPLPLRERNSILVLCLSSWCGMLWLAMLQGPLPEDSLVLLLPLLPHSRLHTPARRAAASRHSKVENAAPQQDLQVRSTLLQVFDLRAAPRMVGSVPFRPGPTLLQFHPKFSSTLLVGSTAGVFTLADIQGVSYATTYQARLHLSRPYCSTCERTGPAAQAPAAPSPPPTAAASADC